MQINVFLSGKILVCMESNLISFYFFLKTTIWSR